MPSAWPMEEIWGRPLFTLVAAALVPPATGRILGALTLPVRIPRDPAEAAAAVAPFRAGALFVGVVQVQLAWVLGATALGSAVVARADGVASFAFAAFTATVAFVAGGPARRIESERAGTLVPGDWLGQAALRLRMVPWLSGPVLAASACAALPVVDAVGDVQVGMLVGAALLTLIGAAYAGPMLSVLTGALRPATPRIRDLAQRAARREGVTLLAVLRLPTHGVRFANAAAIPWARTMIVTDHIVELLDEQELDAVLAHEAGHLSEPAWVGLCRLGTVAALLFVSTTGGAVAEAIAPGSATLVTLLALILAIPSLGALLGLARRMEERADARARETVSPDALADALGKLALDARAPLVTGRKRARLHPDLFDRICGCGRDLGPRPPAPRRGSGVAAGLLISAGLVAAAWGTEVATRIEPGTEAYAGPRGATWRLRVDPWDAGGMLALAWVAARDDDRALASSRLAEARRLGARASDAMELDAELLASEGRCAEARVRFDEALAERARERFLVGGWEPLELGGYHLPPALVTRCGDGD